MGLHFVDLFIVCSYLAICLYIGIAKSLKIKTFHDFISFKDITLPILICTLLSSSIGVGTTLGITEKIYLFGAIFAIRQLLMPIYWLISTRIIAPRISHFNDCLTISEIMNKLYGSSARWVTSYTSVMFIIGSLSMQILAMGYVLHYFFGVDQLYGSIISSGILLTYSLLGGMRAIIFSEVFKFTIFILIIPASCLIAMIKVGGIENIINSLPKSHTQFNITSENLPTLISFIIYSILPSYNPELVQRYLIARNSSQLKSAFKAAFGFSIIIALSITFISYLVKSSGYSGDSAEVLLFFIQEYLPVGLKGVMIAGLLAIFMSKSESSVSATSIIIVNDILKLLFPQLSQKRQLLLLRFFIFGLICIALIVSSSATQLIDILWFARNFWDPIIFIPLTAGFLGFKTNDKSFLSSAFLAIIFTIGAGIYIGEFATISYCFGIMGSGIGFFIAHYLQILLGHIKKQQIVESSLHTKVIKPTKISIILSRVKEALLKNHQTKQRYDECAVYSLISLFAYGTYFMVSKSNPIIGTTLLIGYSLCLLFVFREGLFTKTFITKYLPAFWYLILTYCLPFTAGCLLFFSDNQAFWILSGVLTIFSLSFFVDSIRFLILTTVGIGTSYLLYLSTTDAQTSAILGNVGYIYLFIFLGTLYFLRSREIENQKKIENLNLYSGAIAHEVKNPIASINMSAQTLNDIINNSQIETSGDKVNITLDLAEFDMLKNISKNLESITNHSVSTIDNILSNIKNHNSPEDKGIYNIEEIIKLTLQEYDPSGSRIDIEIVDNFTFIGSLNNIKHLLLNLLNNVKDHAGLDVHISITAKDNKLFFKDHGQGITVDDTARIFNNFYTKSKKGTGIGLAFCKMVMEEMGGNIECHSEIGKYTEFVISFN